MKRGRIQAKDIPDLDFLRAVYAIQKRGQRRWMREPGSIGAFYRDHLPRATWGFASSSGDSEEAIAFRRRYGPFMDAYFPDIPNKVMRAKGQRLIDRGLLDGCMCGCRGDMEITEAGLAFIGVISPAVSEAVTDWIGDTVVTLMSVNPAPPEPSYDDMRLGWIFEQDHVFLPPGHTATLPDGSKVRGPGFLVGPLSIKPLP